MESTDQSSDRAWTRVRSCEFTTTHWTAVLVAGQPGTPQSHAALEQLCRTYWYPLYAYVRRKGHSADDAPDLVQAFFSRFLQNEYIKLADRNRGRFRTFLLTSLKHFLINEYRKAQTVKRGTEQSAVSLDDEGAELRFAAEPATEQAPDMLYDSGWAAILLERGLIKLRAEAAQSGKSDQFERLKPFVWGEKNALSYEEMGREMGMSEGAVKVAVHRLRQRYGEVLRAEIAQTVSSPTEVDDELRYLISVIRNGLSESR